MNFNIVFKTNQVEYTAKVDKMTKVYLNKAKANIFLVEINGLPELFILEKDGTIRQALSQVIDQDTLDSSITVARNRDYLDIRLENIYMTARNSGTNNIKIDQKNKIIYDKVTQRYFAIGIGSNGDIGVIKTSGSKEVILNSVEKFNSQENKIIPHLALKKETFIKREF